jgi:hypothetical protein
MAPSVGEVLNAMHRLNRWRTSSSARRPANPRVAAVLQILRFGAAAAVAVGAVIAARQQGHVHRHISGTLEEQRDAGASIPALVQRMWSGSDEDKSRAARALCAVCDSHSSNQQRAADAHAITALVRLLESAGSDEAVSEAAACLAAVCDGYSSNQQQATDAGAIPALALLLRTGSDKAKSEAAAALGALRRSQGRDSS